MEFYFGKEKIFLLKQANLIKNHIQVVPVDLKFQFLYVIQKIYLKIWIFNKSLKLKSSKKNHKIKHIIIGAELGGAAGARAPPLLHNPRKFIVYSIYSPKFPVPALYVVHLHYLEHFGASADHASLFQIPYFKPRMSANS